MSEVIIIIMRYDNYAIDIHYNHTYIYKTERTKIK